MHTILYMNIIFMYLKHLIDIYNYTVYNYLKLNALLPKQLHTADPIQISHRKRLQFLHRPSKHGAGNAHNPRILAIHHRVKQSILKSAIKAVMQQPLRKHKHLPLPQPLLKYLILRVDETGDHDSGPDEDHLRRPRVRVGCHHPVDLDVGPRCRQAERVQPRELRRRGHCGGGAVEVVGVAGFRQ